MKYLIFTILLITSLQVQSQDTLKAVFTHFDDYGRFSEKAGYVVIDTTYSLGTDTTTLDSVIISKFLDSTQSTEYSFSNILIWRLFEWLTLP